MELINIKENNTTKNAINDKEIQTEVDHEKTICKRQETYDIIRDKDKNKADIVLKADTGKEQFNGDTAQMSDSMFEHFLEGCDPQDKFSMSMSGYNNTENIMHEETDKTQCIQYDENSDKYSDVVKNGILTNENENNIKKLSHKHKITTIFVDNSTINENNNRPEIDEEGFTLVERKSSDDSSIILEYLSP